jgi:uncharacterized protein (DUF697 family)
MTPKDPKSPDQAPKINRRRRRPYQEPAAGQPDPQAQVQPEPQAQAQPELEAQAAFQNQSQTEQGQSVKVEVLEPEESPRVSPFIAGQRQAKAKGIIRRYSAGAAVLGLVPLPVVDMAALAGLQLIMLAELAKLHQVPFKPWQARPLIGALVGGVAPVAAATGLLGYALRKIPLVGPAVGVLTLPVLAGAATLALGRLFNLHFALGDSLVDLDPERLRDRFSAEFSQARAEFA